MGNCASVAQVGIVRPNDDFAAAEAPVEMGRERMQSLGHMPVPEIPGIDTPLEHAAIVFFRVFHKPGILHKLQEWMHFLQGDQSPRIMNPHRRRPPSAASHRS